MRLYSNTVYGVVNAIDEIFNQDRYADKVIEKTLRSNPKWGAREPAFIAESIYAMVRWSRLINTISLSDVLFHLFATCWLMQGHELPPGKELQGFSTADMKFRYNAIT